MYINYEGQKLKILGYVREYTQKFPYFLTLIVDYNNKPTMTFFYYKSSDEQYYPQPAPMYPVTSRHVPFNGLQIDILKSLNYNPMKDHLVKLDDLNIIPIKGQLYKNLIYKKIVDHPIFNTFNNKKKLDVALSTADQNIIYRQCRIIINNLIKSGMSISNAQDWFRSNVSPAHYHSSSIIIPNFWDILDNDLINKDKNGH